MRWPGLALVVLSGVYSPMAAAQARPLDYHRISGCYSLKVGQWDHPLGADNGLHTLPNVVRLDTTLAIRGGRVLTPDISFPRPRRFPGWPRWQVFGDTVSLIWSDGFAPTVVRLTRVADHLEGHAEALSDAIPAGKPKWPRASAIARRTKCKE
jgi:hypothetical protein